MKKLLLLLLIPISFLNAIEIDEYKTDVYFANGIKTNDGNASANTKLLRYSIIVGRYNGSLEEYEKHIAKVTEAYNETHFAGLGDLVESLLQKLSAQELFDDLVNLLSFTLFQTSHDANLETQVTAYTESIKSGHKVLVVAHSQGNLFTYEARNRLLLESNQGWMEKYFEVVSVASPAMFSISNDTPLISWDNDLVAWLGIYNASMVSNDVRKIGWKRIAGEIGSSPKPLTSYVRKEQVGNILNTDWQASEEYIDYSAAGSGVIGLVDDKVHAFTFYMGEDLAEGNIVNPFDGSKLHTSKAKTLIMSAVNDQIDKLEALPSQWKPKNLGCLCKEKYAKMMHIHDPNGMYQYLSNEQVKNFTEDEEGKIYKADAGDHAEYIRANNAERVVTIEEVEDSEVCYVLKDVHGVEVGQIKGEQEQPKTKDGVVEIFLSWNKPELDYDLIVEWDAGEVDVKDTGCTVEHFHILSEKKIYPGTYRVSIVPKDGSDVTFEDPDLYPFEIDLITKTPGASDKMHFEVKNQSDITLGHVSDIKVFRVDDENNDNNNDDNTTDDGNDNNDSGDVPSGTYPSAFIIVPDVAPECPPVQITPSPVPPTPIYFPSGGSSGGWSWYGGSGGTSYGGGGTSSGSYPTIIPSSGYPVQQDPGCGGDIDCLPTPSDSDNNTDNPDTSGNPYAPTDPIVGGVPTRDLEEEDNCTGDLSCACIPCEYEIIPYLKQIYFGPLRDANFSIYSLDGYLNKDSLFDGKTTNGDTLYDAGEIDVPQVFLNTLEDDKLYIIEAQGGEDIDSNDDFVVDAVPRKNLGKVYAIASGKDIKYTGFKVNILTTVTFELLQQSIIDGDTQEILEQKISQIASRLLKYKVYPNQIDSNITNVDLLAWLPTVDQDLLLRSYAPLKEMVEQTYAGESIYAKAYEYVFYQPQESNASSGELPFDEPVMDEGEPPIIKTLVASIDEDAQGGTIVGKIEVLRGSSDISFGELSGKGNEVFEVNSEGEVKLRDGSTLDYETKWLYKLKVEAFNKNGSSGYVAVYISVTNVLDAPEYIGYEGGLVDENITAGTVVGQMLFDQGASPITEILMNGTSPDVFTIDSNGTIRLAEGASLDYEDKYSYGFVVLANNSHGSSMPVILYINIRDIADTPQITNYTGGYVHEDAVAGTFVGQVEFNGGGSAIENIYLSGEGSENFTVDMNGNIHVSDTAVLDYETYVLYRPTVTITNSYGSAIRRIFISVVDTKDVPTFTSFSGGNVRENSPVGTVVAQVIFDQGSMPIDTIVMSGEGSKNFKVLENGMIVVAQDSLNYEEKNHYVVYVTASNALGSSQVVTVHILIDDVSEVPVVLEDFVVNNVEENLPIGTVIGKVTILNEGSSAIELFEVLGDDADKFSVDPEGVVRIEKALDFEEKEDYNLQVKAKNSAGFGYEVNLIIRLKDIPDVVPSLTDIVASLEENSIVSIQIGETQVLNEGDTPISSFSLSGTGSDKFTIDNQGILRNKAGETFDYETYRTYTFSLVASNVAGDSLPVGIRVNIINIPDVIPVLLNTTLNVEENSPENTLVGMMDLSTKGDSEITEYVTSSVDSNHFMIDQDGSVKVSAQANLDYEIKTSYSFQVVAISAAGESLPVSLAIEINNIIDDEPVLNDMRFDIEENITVGSIVGNIQVNSTGTSDIISMTLSGMDAQKFSVDANGTVRLTEAVDYEVKRVYEFEAIATNEKADSPTAKIVVNVLNIPEYVPILMPFSKSVSEDTAVDSIIGIMSIKNPGDTPITAYHLNDTSLFNIDSNGTIVLHTALDYEIQTNHTMKVTATNGAGASKPVSLTIDVLNIVERVPTIELRSITQFIRHDIEVGTIVANVVSNGSTIDESTVDGYSIISGNANNMFAIDNDGFITIFKPFNMGADKDYTLEVVATNMAGNSMTISLYFQLLQPFEIDKKNFLKKGIFGSEVAIHHNTIAVGDRNQKTVYIYDVDMNSSVNELAMLRYESSGYDAFGSALAMNDQYLVVGAKSDDTEAHDAGAVHIFRRDVNESMVKIDKLTGSKMYGNLGLSVALHPKLIAVAELSTVGTTGRVLLYKKDENNNFYNYKILDDGKNSTNFGNSISIWGDYMVVGAKSDSEVALSAGAAYVYKIEANNDITLLQKITASDGADYDSFGESVAIHGGMIVIGASGKTSQTGAAYVFMLEKNDNIRALQKITASDGKAKDYFGKAITINDDFIVIGSKNAMYLFVELGDIEEYIKLTGHDNTMLVDNIASDGSKIVSLSTEMLYVYDTQPKDRLYIYGDTNATISTKEGYIGSLYNIEAGSPNSALTYTLDINDGSNFSIIDTNLTLELALDFENPLDMNSDNVYQTSITIEDIKGHRSDINIDINITNKVALEIAKKVASDKHYEDYFGLSVAMNDNIIVVSAPYKDYVGAVYVFEKDQNDHIQELTKLMPLDTIAWGNFGSSVDVSGDLIVVGADGHRNDNGVNTGAVYVYKILANGTIEELQKIVPENGENWDGFGRDVSIDGDIIVIGTSYVDAAYVFRKDTNGTISQLEKLTASGGGVNDGFGTSVSISDTSIIIGSSDDKGMGSVYLFEVNIDDITEVANFIGSDTIPYDGFGFDIDISGSTIVVGSPYSQGQGKAYVFQKDLIGNVKEIGKITTTVENANFGESVSTMNDLIIVGAPGSESMHLYQINVDDTISKLEVLSSSDGGSNDYFGASIDIYGNYIVVGAPYKYFQDLHYSGAIYLYNKVPGL